MKTVFRLVKIQTTQELGNKCHHIYKLTEIEREEFKKNRTHLKKPIFTIKGSFGNAYKDIKELKLRNNLESRKDSAKAMELIFSMSPDFFNNFDKDRIKDFTNKTLQYLRENFQEEEIAHIALHLHEDTPHIHCFVVPWELQNKRGRYESEEYKLIKTKKYTPTFLSQLQKKFWLKFESYGLEPLDQKVKNHTELKEYYQKVIIEKEEEKNEMRNVFNKYSHAIKKLNEDLENEKTINHNLNNEIKIRNEIIQEQRKEINFFKSKFLEIEKIILSFFKVKTLTECLENMKNRTIDFFSKKEEIEEFESLEDWKKSKPVLDDGLELPHSMEDIKENAEKRTIWNSKKPKPKP